jgi:hypothetical protein
VLDTAFWTIHGAGQNSNCDPWVFCPIEP